MRQVYEFIKAHQAEFATSALCGVLGKSRSAFYAWLKGDSHQLNAQKLSVRDEVKQVFELHKRHYGSRRIEAELKENGGKAGRYQIRNRMQEQGLKAIQPRSFIPKTTQTNPNLLRNPNLLLEMDKVEAIDKVWVGDIPYLALADGSWAYLAVWMDLFSRMIVGWKYARSMVCKFRTLDNNALCIPHLCCKHYDPFLSLEELPGHHLWNFLGIGHKPSEPC